MNLVGNYIISDNDKIFSNGKLLTWDELAWAPFASIFSPHYWPKQHCVSRHSWEQCPYGDWMLWLTAYVGIDRKLVTLVACDCVESALIHVPDSGDLPRIVIETARLWCLDKTTIEKIKILSNSVSIAAEKANHDNDAIAYHILSAAACASKIIFATNVSYYARHVAYHTAFAAYHAANDVEDVYKKSLVESANLVRRRISYKMILEVAQIKGMTFENSWNRTE